MYGRRPIYKKVTIDNIIFDSQDEANYYLLLKEKLEKKEIFDLQIHPVFILIPEYTDSLGKKHNSLKYEADFVYTENETNKMHAVDIKGYEEEHFKIKKKIFEYLYCYTEASKMFDKLEVLTYRKTLNGFVETEKVKALMKTARQKLIAEKNYYKDIVKKQEREKELEAKKKSRELERLNQLENILRDVGKLNYQQKKRYDELVKKYIKPTNNDQ